MTQDMNQTITKVLKVVLVVTMMSLMGTNALAQVTVSGNVYGGGNAADVGGDATVNISAGQIGVGTINTDHGNVFGGGKGQVTTVVGKVEVNIGKIVSGSTVSYSDKAIVKGSVYGGSALGVVNARKGANYNTNPADIAANVGKETKVNIYGGTIAGSVFGGGLGRIADTEQGISAIDAKVYGDVTVNINENNGTGIISGSVFGCNNANGTPLGDVTVNVYGTKGTGTAKPDKFADYINVLDPDEDSSTEDLGSHLFELAAVYGGGNLAAYVPVDGKKTTVNIYGCEKSSIKEVYGGGSAASVPECAVNVYGGYEIGYVYGGGNGTQGAANVGKNGTTLYGTGNATTTINGGTIYRVFAGPNLAGDIIGTARLNIADDDTSESCDPLLGDVFSYGNHATMSGTSVVNMGCLNDKVGALYGGAMNADIDHDIILNINGGKYHQVFGGNKSSGTIYGSIKVNIEKTTDCTLEIDELYGCGNNAEYTTLYTEDEELKNYADPEINIISCTRIGNVYGGGYGARASVTGNPKVNINMVKATGQTALGTIENVYGGGMGAAVTGNTIVNIGTTATVTLPSNNSTTDVEGANITGSVYGGGEAADVTGSTTVKIGTVNYANSTDVSIGGDVYGGGEGNGTHVTEKATVNLGANGVGNSTVTGDIYGGSAFGTVNNVEVNLYKGSVRNVFGGGKGQTGETAYIAHVTGSSSVTLYDATVTTAVYGGCNENGNMAAGTNVTLKGGIVGNAESTTIDDVVFGGGLGLNTSVTGNVAINVGTKSTDTEPVYEGKTQIYGSVYGGSKEGSVHSTEESSTDKTNVNLYSGLIYGNVYGGGYGVSDNASAAASNGNVIVTLDGAAFNVTYDTDGKPKTGQIFGCNNVNGSPKKHVTVNVLRTRKVADPAAPTWTYSTQTSGTYEVAAVYGGGNLAAYTAAGESTEVNISGSSSIGVVYGGGNQANVPASSVIIGNSFEIGNVFGGGNAAGVSGISTVTLNSGKVLTALYGGCNTSGTIGGAVTVTVNGGTIGNQASTAYQNDDVLFGGGLGKDTRVTGDITVGLANSSTANIYGNVYGGSKQGGVSNVDVNLFGATVWGNVFGGGYNTYTDVTAANDVTVTLNGSTLKPTYDNGNYDEGKQSGLTGQIFGGNNQKGSPIGQITVHVIKTTGTVDKTTESALAKTRDERTEYDVAAVYGGGNQAPYTATGKSAMVIIEGCDETAIKYVYGGGNAASVPGTDVTVKGTYIIDVLYGGGNGITTAADVNGVANVKLIGGKIHKVYGGSNSNGNVGGGTNVNMPKNPETTGNCIKPDVREIYGAGNNADQDGGTTIVLGCVEGLDVVYGGAKNANIKGGVNLAVTSGTFKKVFGGNDTAGTIQGPINLYIEETGCDPLIIGELYLGGNLAPYSVYGYYNAGNDDAPDYQPRTSKDDTRPVATGTTAPPSDTKQYIDPVLHVTSFTSIGKIFGGGYGEKAILYGNPTVKISEIVGENSSTAFTGKPMTLDEGEATEHTVTLPGRAANAIGSIGDVYGGGSLAKVIGNTTVEVCKDNIIYMHSKTPDSDGNYPSETVVGAHIMGNVFGGGLGYSATVEGNTELQVGSGTEKDITIAKSVYGGGELAPVSGNTNVVVNNGIIGTANEGSTVYGGAVYGNVYGGGLGSVGDGTDGLTDLVDINKAGVIRGNTKITINGGTVLHNIYGGGANGSVGDITYGDASYVPGKTSAVSYLPTEWTRKTGETGTNTGTAEIYIYGGTIGQNGKENGMVFGSSRGNVATPTGTPAVDPNDRLAWVYDTKVVIGSTGSTGPDIKGSVYGSGENGHVFSDTQVNIHSGTIGVTASDDLGGPNYRLRGNVYGGGCGEDEYTLNGTKHFNPLAGIVLGTANVTIDGGQVVHNVYGAGALGSVVRKTTVNLSGNAVIGVEGATGGDVFGAARGKAGITFDGSNLANVQDVEVNVNGSRVWGNVYGGGEAGYVKQNVVVSMTDGVVTKDIYGGGALGDTNTGNSSTSDYTTKVFLLGGTIINNVYGGGLGEKKYVNGATADNPAYVNGNVTVYLNGTEIADYDATKHSALVTSVDADGNGTNDYYHTKDDINGCVVKGSIFGCNNLCGTPKGKVKVHVFKTQGDGDTHQKSANRDGSSYDLTAVYGGGNLAAYEPTISGTETEANHAHTDVIIEGCDLTSIEYVYGGGNAASAPATNVTVNGSYEIGEVFGGGNGADRVPVHYNNQDTQDNPGANVGFHEYGTAWGTYTNPYDTKENRAQYYGYGLGKAQVNINGGLVHAVYGGSNSKGNVREVAIAMLDHVEKSCTFKVDEAYGGGKSANMDGKAILQLGCVPSITEVYGGARNADVNGDVELTITNGTYDRVFGGNNVDGDINGTITVNIEETGCEEIIIGQLFGGGNQADYRAPVGKSGPVLNVRSFTSIGEIFGGGFGSTAKVYGDINIKIDEVVGDHAIDYSEKELTLNVGQPNEYKVVIPAHTAGKIGTIGDIYGGGYGADVIGDVKVNIATEPTVTLITGTKKGIAQNVVGVDIARSVYGGGYGEETNITGNVEVNIGRLGASDAVKENITIGQDVYGGSALGKVNKPASGETTDKTTKVNLYAGKITRNVYGGGMGVAPAEGVTAKKAEVWGDTEVKMYGDMITGALYGGCNLNGVLKKKSTVSVIGGTLGTAYGATSPATYPDILFGGGYGPNTEVLGDVTVNVGDLSAATKPTIWGSVYGGSAKGSVNSSMTDKTTVNLVAGIVNGDVFGGGLGDATYAAEVKGGTTVNLNQNDGTCEVTGNIFGCNNANGSPKGHVLVHVFKTVKTGNTKDTSKTLEERQADAKYDLSAVFGGGNRADYQPTEATEYAEVIIDGCDKTSIHEVYGGGYGAATPATLVKIQGTYFINEAFGGGYGAGENNPGANVGYYTYTDEADKTPYPGDGKTRVELYGGMVHTIYGGSNTKGNIRGGSSVDKKDKIDCDLEVRNIYGAGKNADQDAGTILTIGCVPGLKNVYGGAKDANIKGGVNLVITGGDFENVFGGNDTSGTIQGPIKLYIEESCAALNIGNLYLGGNQAAYSVYGYYLDSDGKLQPRTSKTDGHAVADGTTAPDVTTGQYANPQLYVTKFTSIGNVYGGGFGEGAVMYGSPTVNINEVANLANGLGEIGNVFGGGDAAKVEGNTTVNIGTETMVEIHADGQNADGTYPTAPVKGVVINENVYGGGNKADVTGNTKVNICAKDGVTAVAEGTSKVTIGGDVYGGGKGEAAESGDRAFYCEKAMVGIDGDGIEHPDGGTTVIIGNGTVNGTVYGGGELGRVEKNTVVTIGLGDGVDETKETPSSAPEIKGNVFGGGKGKETHGYAALVRGNPAVTVQGNAKVRKSVYGGGEIASVARYQVGTDGKPHALANNTSGNCIVNVQGYAEIGPNGMKMNNTTTGKPDDWGHVFGAGKGVLPEVHSYAEGDRPYRIDNTNNREYYTSEEDYFEFVQTLALASQTNVTISGHAFVKGSVYGGSENGLVQYDTHVAISGGQIGCGEGKTVAYSSDEWTSENPSNFTECASWEYKAPFAPYDPYAQYQKDGKYYYDLGFTKSAEGGAVIATDGHTYYGNVFGGGSGSIPYFDTLKGVSRYIMTAGQVKGDTYVTISGGHILTNVYGGCESTNVLGMATVTMTGGTIGVPRTDNAIINHPLTGYLFGGGKGDQRVLFNKDTNVKDAVVNVTGGRIYGSVYGGGEDGHVLRNVTMTVGNTDKTGPKIGTKGTSYYDGHVFGGGRGFGGDALTAGNVGGAVDVNIESGNILGSVYGGGRLASVGYGLYLTTETGYGVMRADDEYDGSYTNPSTDPAGTFFNKGRGKITVTVRGGTIGNDETDDKYGGNVFGGSMGRLTKLDGSAFDSADHWSLLATAKKTTVNVSGGTIKRSVYGGGEMGTVTTDAVVTVSGGTIGTSDKGGAEYGNIYGGGKGYVDPAGSSYITAGIIKGNTTVTINPSTTTEGEPKIYHNVYGGGAYGSVGTFTYDANNVISEYTSGGKATISITGGEIGEDGSENGMIFGSSRGDVGAPGSIHDKLAWVYDTEVTISGGQIKGSVYGGGENGHNYHDAVINIHGGTVGIAEGSPIGTYTAGGASYPYRGNVYGGGCGTDKYYEDPALETHDGNGQLYNLLAGIVRGDATVNMTGGTVVHNMYGAGAMGSVGVTNADGTTSGGLTTINISGGTVGVSGTVGDGNVFGAARGDHDVTEIGLAQVRETSVNISSGTVKGNVYGGGEVGNVGIYTETGSVGNYNWNESTGLCTVTISGGTIGSEDVALSKDHGNVFGGGKGVSNTFECEKAMVYRTNVTISNNSTVNGTVYGGGEVGRVENNTVVTIGTENGTDEPEIKGNVFAAGAGTKTHGYSALVRGHASATVQGKAKVLKNIYGGGEEASVGRYKVKTPANAGDDDVPESLPYGMPAVLLNGGISTVVIQDNAVIGTDNDEKTGHVYGAGQGIDPYEVAYTYESDATKPSRMVSGNKWEYFADEAAYLQFVETLALTGKTDVTIDEAATVKGSVFGGSESGFVYHDTDVKIKNGTIKGDAFGGGRGLATFAEAGRVSGNTNIAISDGTVQGNIYGGGNLGDVGTIKKNTDYNYTWKNSDCNGNIYATGNDNTAENNKITGTNKNTGICKVTVSGGTIGIDNPAEPTKHGNVFGAGEGLANTWWCEKAIAFSTDVSITKGTVKGNIYGGGQIGRVEDDAKVTIGAPDGTDNLVITGSVFGAGAGLATHGYSALVRGNSDVTVQGKAQIGGSVYGGGETASVGRFTVVGGLPKHPDSGGTCTVIIKDNAAITGEVFGACKGVTPAFVASGENRSKSMQLATNAPSDAGLWSHYNNDEKSPFIWRYYPDEDAYLAFLETLALTSNTDVTIGGNASVNESVYGGGQRGVTLGSVKVDMLSGTVNKDVYGGGALANTNKGNWDDDKGAWADGKTSADYTTTVNLTGGLIGGDAYGGGLGQLEAGTKGQDGYVAPVAAIVYGDVSVTLNGTAFNIGNYTDDKGHQVVKSGRVFGCNNLNGSPMGQVTVIVNKTVAGNVTRTDEDPDKPGKPQKGDNVTSRYELAAVYGGGNLASYIPAAGDATTNVIINDCDVSIQEVYGGGNAAAMGTSEHKVSTDVLVKGAYEIGQVFGGGNGEDKYTLDNGATWNENPGADITGNTNTLLLGGTIHEAYGGSNEKGTITGNIKIDAGADENKNCPLDVEKIVGAGKNADVNGDLNIILGCKPSGYIPIVYGGADNANVNGNVELTITSGNYGKVFGGNNLGGAILGHIVLNIEETGECETPINIEELYLGGNQATYSVYGYYREQNGVDKDGNPVNIYKPRTSATDKRKPYKRDGTEYATIDEFKCYEEPILNVISCTSIGGGYGVGGDMYANPTVNINMIPGSHAGSIKRNGTANNHDLGEIGNVFGGGNAADVIGNTTVNIGTAETVHVKSWIYDPATDVYTAEDRPVEGAYITGKVYGGGNLADVKGNTYVNICAKYDETKAKYVAVPEGNSKVIIDGDVFGGGKGVADNFKCDKAMVGIVDDGVEHPEGGTSIIIGNGTVNGTVYGGGEIGRVEKNTVVTIGLEDDTSAPVITGNVFGAGKGLSTHGYSALVRGNTTVTVQGDAKVRESIFGGGEIASVGRYQVANAAYHNAHPEVEEGMPYSLANSGSGYCTVIVRGNAEIGPDGMKMNNTVTGKPDDTGHVFGAGKGILPYEGYTSSETPWRMAPDNTEEHYSATEYKGEGDYEDAYLKYVESLGLVTQTDVVISGNAFVKGSVYGGSENGHVQHDTHVTIEGGQIGCGKQTRERYPDAIWDANYVVPEGTDLECASWDYVPTDVAPYDPYAKYKKDGKYYYDEACTKTAEGGYYIGKDGHTYYGNVFGGGSGVIPYAPGKWHRASGSVGGNTQVDITGGHILTSVYGGNEQTDVGTYMKDDNGALTIPVSGGKCTVNMTGGTLGVPRTVDQMKAHPLTCYLFGAGKGDQRIFFNTWTNVINTEVNITGNARIYGSTFGGGEDGHIIKDAVTNIGGTVTIGTTNYSHSNVIIGTTGTSYVDGNIFGGGRGFSGDAQTAGTVGGNIEVNIKDGKMLGSVYGGGRLASVGTMFTNPESEFYGQFKEDDAEGTYGHVAINISGGVIGNDIETIAVQHTKGGNVFGGSMGRLERLDGSINPLWPKLAQVKTSTINITGGTIKNNVYGGGEMGTVREDARITIEGGTLRRDVYGGGYGSDDYKTKTSISVAGYEQAAYTFTPMQWAGCVGGDTYVNIKGGQVRKSVYGGGEMASVGIINYTNVEKNDDESNGFVLSWPYKFEYIPYLDGKPVGGATHVNITGGRIGVTKDDDDIDTDNGDVYGAGKGIAGDYNDYVFCANVRSSEVNVNINSNVTPTNYMTGGDCITGAVYGGGENGHVMEDTKLTITNGLVGHSIYGGGSGKGTFSKKLLKIGKTAGSTNENDYYTRDIYSITAGKVFGNTEVNVKGGHVVRNVYGGGNMGSVGKGNYAGGADDYSTAGYGEKLSGNLWDGVSEFSQAFLNSGKCVVNITGGTIGYIDESDPSNSMYPWNSTASLPYGNVFGGCRGESAPNITESPRYLYSPEFFVGYANETQVTIEGNNTKILGSVYGGGMDGHIRRDASVIIKGGEIGLPFTDANRALLKTNKETDLSKELANIQWVARGNVYGAGSGIGKYKYDFDYDGKYTSTVTYNGRQTKEEDNSTSAGSVTRFTTVNIQGGTIHRNVYGGGSLSSIGAPKIGQSYNLYCKGDTEADHGEGKQTLNEVNISGGQIGDEVSRAADYGGHVFGGSRGDASLNTTTFSTSMFTKVNMGGGKVLGSVFGGGEVGIIKGSVVVDVTGGEIESDVYGGGALANTNTANPEGVTDQYTTTVNLLGGTINDAFGGGLGQKKGANGATSDIEAIVYGDVHLNLNGLESADYVPAIHSSLATDVDDTDGKYYLAKDGCVVTGNVFGCNNYNGTPMGHSKVHVFKTKAKTDQVADGYDVSAVFGGGNQADYVPAASDTKQSTEVIIEGCDLTSIENVYGGGYGAATPGTNVLVKGTKIIDNVFGGGYGAGTDNPGANVGFRTGGTAYPSGDGKAVVQLMAGKVNNVYGGSNTKGDIRNGSSVTNVANDGGPGCCTELKVEEIYGGGKSADMYGGAEICLACMPNDWIGSIYAGAEKADVGNDISLTLTSGRFERVYGGNKSGGKIDGYIEVNIEENPECSTPIIIGELYGGGNEAPYEYSNLAKDPDYPSPRVNVRAFTSIGTIYGGGYGKTATVKGNPTVNINVVEGGREYGGETRKLDDGSNVTLYARSKDGKIGVIGNVFGGGNAAKVEGTTHVNIGTTTEEQMVSLQTKDDKGNVIVVKKPVVGADIRGNVYGGGNQAEVTGGTNVTIGEKKITTPPTTTPTTPSSGN